MTMNILIEKMVEADLDLKVKKTIRLYNPEGMDHTNTHRVKSIEITDEYTRIDFIYRSSSLYYNGGWIQIEKDTYIQAKGSTLKNRLVKAIGVPIAPDKHYFNRKGEYYTYTLIFPALPKNTKTIDIIEKLAPGTYFNFFDVNFSKWMTVPHAADLACNHN